MECVHSFTNIHFLSPRWYFQPIACKSLENQAELCRKVCIYLFDLKYYHTKSMWCRLIWIKMKIYKEKKHHFKLVTKLAFSTTIAWLSWNRFIKDVHILWTIGNNKSKILIKYQKSITWYKETKILLHRNNNVEHWLSELTHSNFSPICCYKLEFILHSWVVQLAVSLDNRAEYINLYLNWKVN